MRDIRKRRGIGSTIFSTRRAGVVTAVTFNYRGNPLVQQARHAMIGEKTGKTFQLAGRVQTSAGLGVSDFDDRGGASIGEGLAVSGQAADGFAVARARALPIDGVIADVIKNPARAEDLERVKTQLIAEAIYAQDNQATLARWYGGALTTGLSIDDIRSWPERIRAVTAEQVRDAARKWLEKNRSVTGYLIKDPAPKREEKRS